MVDPAKFNALHLLQPIGATPSHRSASYNNARTTPPASSGRVVRRPRMFSLLLVLDFAGLPLIVKLAFNRLALLPTIPSPASFPLLDAAFSKIKKNFSTPPTGTPLVASTRWIDKAFQSPRVPECPSHLGSSSSERNDVWPLNISNCPSPYRSKGVEGRLLPFNLEDSDGLPLYQINLENFYLRHKNPAHVSIADAAFQCLKKENKLRLYWMALKAIVIPSDALLSNDIFDCMLQLVQNGGESEAPFVIDAAAGIIKEAELILENMRCGNLDAIDTSNKIRRFAIEFLRYKFAEIESDEMTSDVDGEVNQPTSTCCLTGEVEKNGLKKQCDYMDKQPKKTEGGTDFLTLLEKGYLTRKTIIATDRR